MNFNNIMFFSTKELSTIDVKTNNLNILQIDIHKYLESLGRLVRTIQFFIV